MRLLPAIVALVLALVLAGCGGDDDGRPSEGDTGTVTEPPATAVAAFDASEPGPIHIHGIGVNPADNSLQIATHTGLYRLPEGGDRAERVGSSYRDLMGFSIVGPDEFLASGHPGAPGEGPPLLGLIRTEDGGRTWETVSLEGEADFHVLRTAHDRVYGWDSAGNRFLVSDDGGRDWDEREVPPGLIDLAVDPDDPRSLVASTQEGIVTSEDGGRGWEPAGDGVGLLAWPAAEELFLLDLQGALSLSDDGGGTWEERGSVGTEPALFAAESPEELYVALHDLTVLRSTDGGETWSPILGG